MNSRKPPKAKPATMAKRQIVPGADDGAYDHHLDTGFSELKGRLVPGDLSGGLNLAEQGIGFGLAARATPLPQS